MNKILIVEDDKFVAKAMALKFQEEGFIVKAFDRAEDGLNILKTWIPDVIILDILLPGIDGYAFLRTIKNDSQLKNIPVIISSNLDEQIGADESANEYIVKSDLDLDDLVKRIRHQINKPARPVK